MLGAYLTPFLAMLLTNGFLANFISVLKILLPCCTAALLLSSGTALVVYDLFNITFGSNSDLGTLL